MSLHENEQKAWDSITAQLEDPMVDQLEMRIPVGNDEILETPAELLETVGRAMRWMSKEDQDRTMGFMSAIFLSSNPRATIAELPYHDKDGKRHIILRFPGSGEQ